MRFDRDIRPLLADACFHCHGPDPKHREADLRLDMEKEAKAAVIIPGNPDASELIARITSRDPDEKMPPPSSNKKLTAEQVEKLRRWVLEGADWPQHWAFLAPEKSAVPAASDPSWTRNEIDHFVLARLDREGLRPSAEAERTTLIRRVTFDLTGLPPTLEEVDAFLLDNTPNAYEKVVDRLLNSHHYGERMTVRWLDAARYGDTSVYHADGRRDMWLWRDHVVDAFNKNLSFDEFSTQLLAGDLLPDATTEQKVLSGFNRNNGTTDEGGLIPEEYRVEYAVDRVKTTSTVWLGLTMECAQCHGHKYDPIPQEDYYRFFAFFNTSADKGSQTRGGNSPPLVEIPDPERQAKLPEVLEKLASIKGDLERHRAENAPRVTEWIAHVERDIAQASSAGSEPGLRVHLRFDENSGDQAVNSVGGAASKIDRGKVKKEEEATKWTEGRTRGGLDLNGKTRVEVSGAGDFERTDAFSFGGWVFRHGGASGALISRQNADLQGYELSIDGSERVEVMLTGSNSQNQLRLRTNRRLEQDRWNHVFATYDGSSKAEGVSVYVDGEPWDFDTRNNTLTESIRTTEPLRIGSRQSDDHLKAIVDEIRVYDRTLEEAEVRGIVPREAFEGILTVAAAQRSDEAAKELRDFYFEHTDTEYRAIIEKKSAAEAEEVELRKPLTTVMVMGDLEKPRETFVLMRGAYDAPTDRRVEPGTPSALPPMPSEAPGNRLGLARWLFQPEHPLTARVAVNQYWQMLFGVGLVATPADFGAQGEFPSHPKLLDWLAVDFRQSGWDIKRLVRQILLSSTYRQTSSAPPELYTRDPGNRLLARGPRFRLQGEFLRDTALAVSGLLLRKFGGPGVKPYQPEGLWKEVGLSGKPLFKQDHGKHLYRRSIYTYWKRSAPPPTMQIFDAPTREKCAIQRPRTNTPLQALVTLNDIQFVEAARGLGERMLLEVDGTERERLIFAFRLVTAREPRDSELAILLGVYRDSLGRYRADTEAAEKLLATGEAPRNPSLDAAEHAATTVLANLLLNLDEALTRE